jgi:hypothetical protein
LAETYAWLLLLLLLLLLLSLQEWSSGVHQLCKAAPGLRRLVQQGEAGAARHSNFYPMGPHACGKGSLEKKQLRMQCIRGWFEKEKQVRHGNVVMVEASQSWRVWSR